MRILLALLALSGLAFADSAGKYGTGRTQPRVSVETQIIGTQNQLQVRFTHNGSTSDWQNASAADPGDGFDADDSSESGNTGGKNFRFKNGKAQYQNASGGWVNLGRKRSGNMGQGGSEYITAGNPMPDDGLMRTVGSNNWVPTTAGRTYGYDVFWIGDDVTTLPDAPDEV